MTPTEEFFTHEEEMRDTLLRLAGIDPEKPQEWPVHDFSYDYYDTSFEFHDVDPEWKPSKVTIKAWGELGFNRCWINYKDGGELAISLVSGKSHYKPPTQ